MAKENTESDAYGGFRLDVPMAHPTPEDMVEIERCLNEATLQEFGAINPKTGKIGPGMLKEDLKKIPVSLSVHLARSLRGMTQHDLAEACEVDQHHINMIERGVDGVPPDVIAKVKKFLELPDEIGKKD